MTVKIAQSEEVKKFLNIVSGTTSDKGNPRTKKIVHRVLTDLFNTIEEFDVQPQEFWAAIDYFNDLGQSMEAGLLTPGLGLEHFLDLRMDAEDKAAGVKQGTPRTIEGPLYVANAPLSKGSARLDDGTDKGEVLFMHGVVRDLDGKPVGGAIVDVWHANTKGMYSFFDKVRANTICASGSKQVRTAVMNSGPSSRRGTVARPTDQPSACWISLAVMANGQHTSISSCRHRVIVTSRRRSISPATSICMTTSHSQHAKDSSRRSYGMKTRRR